MDQNQGRAFQKGSLSVVRGWWGVGGFVLLAWDPANVGNIPEDLEDHQTGVMRFHDGSIFG